MTQPDFTLATTGAPVDPPVQAGDSPPDGGVLDTDGNDGKDDLAKEQDRHERAVMAAAMRLLQHARKQATRTDSSDDTVLRLDGGGKLDKVSRTTLGGARVPATLTRTGVLNYRRGDGTVRRELRLPEEVFHADSLETLRGAPVTVGHPYEIGGLLDAGTYRKFTVGHAEDVRQDGKSLVAGNLVVQDGKTSDAIDRGELTEVSLGYQCKMDEKPGVWNGQPYDAIQRGIKYNHVALLAPGRSRADVGLRLDATDAVCIDQQEQDTPMTVKIKLDGKDFEFGSEAHIEKIEAMHSAAVTKLDEKLSEKKDALKAVTSEKEQLQGKLDAVQVKLDSVSAELTAANDPAALADRVNARVNLVSKARTILGTEAKLDDKSDRDIMIEVIRSDEADFSGDKRSDDYLRGRYESLESKGVVRADSIDAVVRHIEAAKRLDASDPNLSPVVKAQIASIEASRKLATSPVGDK